MLRKYATMVFVFGLINLSFGYSYSAWTSMTGEKTVALNPFFYGGPLDDGFDLTTDLVAGYGLSDKVDLFLNAASLNLKSDVGYYGGSWVMPRYDFGSGTIGAVQLGLTKDANDELSLFGGPHFHLFRENDNWAGELNAYALFYAEKGRDGFAAGSVAPVYKWIKQTLYPFVEFNPVYSFGAGQSFDFSVAPGLWIGIPDTPHQFSLSVPLNGLKDGEVSAGINLWYWYSFKLGAK